MRMRHSLTCRWQEGLVPFSFCDLSQSKLHPAMVLPTPVAETGYYAKSQFIHNEILAPSASRMSASFKVRFGSSVSHDRESPSPQAPA